MNDDAELAKFFRIHVASRAGAQKHDMLQARAFACNLGRQRGVVDDRDLGAVEHAWQPIRRHVRIAVNANLGIAGFFQPFENHGQRFIGIDKNYAH